MEEKGSAFPLDFHFYHKILENHDIKSLYHKEIEFKNLQSLDKVRIILHKINQDQERVQGKQYQHLLSGEFTAIGLIDQIFHYISRFYQSSENNRLWIALFEEKDLQEIFQNSEQKLRTTIERFHRLYPILKNYIQGVEPLLSEADNLEKEKIYFIEELLHLHLSNDNPAFRRYLILFSDHELKRSSFYNKTIRQITSFLNKQSGIGPYKNSLYNLFKEPVLHSPHSIYDQLDYIYRNWAYFLPDYLLQAILLAMDQIREETMDRGAWSGPPETFVPDYGDDDLFDEYEAFSQDRDWMPRVVLIAKSTHVWLFQLSQKYARPVKQLDQIPAEELDLLAAQGFTALWLIGLWERSPASRKIKQWMGNHEALASAYSLYDYQISNDLGGEKALKRLKIRLAKRGIRLAADMVPNHTGIYSRWMQEHPEYFLSLDHSPYPGYNFNCENLSEDSSITIQIEDSYWNHSDAAVVFKYINHTHNYSKYIYHGNDGTSTPWNDTAQLDYSKPEVREAVIQKIIEVAKMFPVIRFDAAMTLTNRHIQRLWFPKPGSGGAIPSRSQHALSNEEFKNRFPNEFWRELVDRIAEEVPDTLLLAEAFWLMEGYFVRTLGMHRVYNSAFMNMLSKEENKKYKKLITETLDFNPEILKRYVNYMNNPDEETAVAQFGKGDKYFGVSLMMITMPGLPMWGHGQTEGFTEKYGMEYARSYYDENPDLNLVKRHENYIFPLLHKRYLFSDVKNFEFYEFFDSNSNVIDDVFAYSNMAGSERSIIIYNNSYNTYAGYIKTSVPKNQMSDYEKNLQSTSLTRALDLNINSSVYYLFKDQNMNLEYIRSSIELSDRGLFAELKGYQSHAFIEFREIYDHDGTWFKLMVELQGKGVSSIEKEYRKLKLAPILGPLRKLLHRKKINNFSRFISFQAMQSWDAINLNIKESFRGQQSTVSNEIFIQNLIDAKIQNNIIKHVDPFFIDSGIVLLLKEIIENIGNSALEEGRYLKISEEKISNQIKKFTSASINLLVYLHKLHSDASKENSDSNTFVKILNQYFSYHESSKALPFIEESYTLHNLINFFSISASFGLLISEDPLLSKKYSSRLSFAANWQDYIKKAKKQESKHSSKRQQSKIKTDPKAVKDKKNSASNENIHELETAIIFREWFLGEKLYELIPEGLHWLNWEDLSFVLIRNHNLPFYLGTSPCSYYKTKVLQDPYSQRVLDVHRFDGVRWFNRERFEVLNAMSWFLSLHYGFRSFLPQDLSAPLSFNSEEVSVLHDFLEANNAFFHHCLQKAEESGYRYDDFLEIL